MSETAISDDEALRRYAELMEVTLAEARQIPMAIVRKHLAIHAEQREVYAAIDQLYGDADGR